MVRRYGDKKPSQKNGGARVWPCLFLRVVLLPGTAEVAPPLYTARSQDANPGALSAADTPRNYSARYLFSFQRSELR